MWRHLPPTSAVRQCAMFILTVRNCKGRALGRAKLNQFQSKLNLKTGSNPQKQSDNTDKQSQIPRKSICPSDMENGLRRKQAHFTVVTSVTREAHYAVCVKTDDLNNQTASQSPADNVGTLSGVGNIKAGVRCCASR